MNRRLVLMLGVSVVSTTTLILVLREPARVAVQQGAPTKDAARERVSLLRVGQAAKLPAGDSIDESAVGEGLAASDSSDREADKPSRGPSKVDSSQAQREFSPDHTTEERQLELIEEQAELGARWSEEEMDRQWRDDTAARVQALLAERALDTSALLDVDCRQTICRVALRSRSTQHVEVKGLIKVARQVDPETWILPERQSDSTYSLEVFFPRGGYRLSGGGGRIDEPPRVVDL